MHDTYFCIRYESNLAVGVVGIPTGSKSDEELGLY